MRCSRSGRSSSLVRKSSTRARSRSVPISQPSMRSSCCARTPGAPRSTQRARPCGSSAWVSFRFVVINACCPRPTSRVMNRVIAVVLLASAGTASADRWMSAELPTAVAVSDVQEQVFRPGAMPAVGGYLQLSSHFAVGVRARAGVLRDRLKAPILTDANRMEPATGGLATAGLAARAMFGGAYVELVAGGGITGAGGGPAGGAGAGGGGGGERGAGGPSARY